MSEPRHDPLDALRIPATPQAPDAAFAAQLRERMIRALLSPQEETVTTSTTSTSTGRPRNGARAGDIAYITLGVPDLDRARAFYGALLGWPFSPGHSPSGAQVDEVVPMIGLWAGPQPIGDRVRGAVLSFRVTDMASTVAAVRAAGGTCTEPHQEPYGLTSEGTDDQGLQF